MKSLLDEIEVLARKAQPGPWYLAENPKSAIDDGLDNFQAINASGHGAFAEVVVGMNDYANEGDKYQLGIDTATYIAAVNPTFMIAFLSAYRLLEQKYKALAGQ